MTQRVWISFVEAQQTGHLPVRIIETCSFRKDASRVLSDEELIELQVHIATNPKAGAVIPGTDGVRKLRYPLKSRGKGKQGGARVIYYYEDEDLPIFLLAFYTKGEKANLSMAERNLVKKSVGEIVAEYKRQRLRLVV